MGSSGKDLLWVGVALAVWVAYQSLTGKLAYKGKSARREENPPVFWAAMALEGLVAVACLGYGLGLTLLPTLCAGFVELTVLGIAAWFIGDTVRQLLKYPLSVFLKERGPQQAVAALLSSLARRPGDRETRFLLAGAYEQADERAAASDLYMELARTNDRWGRGAKSVLQRQNREHLKRHP